ncbi:MAG TPA: ribosomal protein S18-alanine N-acetyltransferase [Syntrophomonadaceae bacterium]|nr:ribosomal protein S18-alanine N-acetyltransferase [Syntrophomonadaceae bacterium]
MVLNQQYIIRRMTDQDLDQIMRIEHESFAIPWSRESYQSELRNHFATYLVCDVEGEVVGYGGIWVVFEEAHITNIAIAESFRSKGLGRALMQALEDVAHKKRALRVVLEVRPSNLIARNLYESLGYVITGERKHYYVDDGEDALIMTKFLF